MIRARHDKSSRLWCSLCQLVEVRDRYDLVGVAVHAGGDVGLDVEQVRPAESLPLGVSPFGAYDMAGNAREWVQPESAVGETAPSIGGSWQAPEYTFGVEWQEELPLGFAGETTGFRCVRHAE